MKNNWKPVLFLILSSVIFTELMTGSTLIVHLINPIIFILVGLVGYGLPVLLIREMYVKWNAGLLSLFVMGLAYGVLNEGVFAKTLLLNDNVPIEFFAGYASFFGINYAWSALIVVWHALLSVVAPILMTHTLFPDKANVSWVSTGTKKSAFVVVVALSTLVFFDDSEGRSAGTIVQWGLFSGFILACLFLAKKLYAKIQLRTDVLYTSIRPLFLGLGSVLGLYILPTLGARVALPTFIILGLVLCLVYCSYRALSRNKWVSVLNVTFFCIGGYYAVGLFPLVFIGIHSIIAPTVIVLFVVLALILRRIKNLYRS